jgi:hypothetical protein
MKTNTTNTTATIKAMRRIVENFRNDLVAPTLLKQEGWDTTEIQFSDADVSAFFRGVGIKITKRGFYVSPEQAQKMCMHIDCLLSLRYMVGRGWMETALKDGQESFRLTEAGAAECARIRCSQSTAAA